MDGRGIAWLLVSAGLMVGCSEPAGTPDETPEALTYFRDVKPIIDAKCRGCHEPDGIGPFSLTSHDEVSSIAALVDQVIAEGTMPPWLAAPGVRPLRYDTSLSEDEVATVRAWIAAEAPAGDPEQEGPPLQVDRGGLSRVDAELAMPEAYTPTLVPDDYRCFPVEWPFDETVFVTGTAGVPGNPLIVHHHAYYLIPPASRATIEGFDEDSEGPGYPCYGGPSLTDSGVSVLASSIGGWAPGSEGADYPAGTGLRVEPGSLLLLQVHYNTLAAQAQPDVSRLALSVESQVDIEAFYTPWLDLEWAIDGEAMRIPAGEAGVHHWYSATFDEAAIAAIYRPADADLSRGLFIHSSYLHMHQLGRTIHLSIEREDGTTERVLEFPRWDFNWQREHLFEEPVPVSPGDRIRVDCWFDNTAEQLARAGRENTTPVDVGFGEGTVDEMCVSFMYMTPQ
ncbi:MAG: monooxygenase [Deltaproteobacteria bacterium]|nr:monooxygenase [Deltaproteobacteria bacterium]